MNKLLVLYLYYISIYGDMYTFSEYAETEKQRKQYYNRPIIKCSQLIAVPVITRKTVKSTKAPRRNAGWRGSR